MFWSFLCETEIILPQQMSIQHLRKVFYFMEDDAREASSIVSKFKMFKLQHIVCACVLCRLPPTYILISLIEIRISNWRFYMKLLTIIITIQIIEISNNILYFCIMFWMPVGIFSQNLTNVKFLKSVRLHFFRGRTMMVLILFIGGELSFMVYVVWLYQTIVGM